MTRLSYSHAGGIVVRLETKHSEFLLVQSSTDPSHWVFPKGHIEPGESSEMAALREIREEAGVEAEILSTLGESKFIKASEQVYVLYFLMRYLAPIDSFEEREIKWCSYDEALATLSFDDARALLKRAKNTLNNTNNRG